MLKGSDTQSSESCTETVFVDCVVKQHHCMLLDTSSSARLLDKHTEGTHRCRSVMPSSFSNHYLR
jgi:hypothetical protein